MPATEEAQRGGGTLSCCRAAARQLKLQLYRSESAHLWLGVTVMSLSEGVMMSDTLVLLLCFPLITTLVM